MAEKPAEKSSARHLFAVVLARVHAICATLAAEVLRGYALQLGQALQAAG